MSKRLQVLIEDKEWAEIRGAARARRVTIAAWVRDALRNARRREPLRDAEKKIEVIRAATRHAFPTGEIDKMLAEIESGYQGKRRR